MRLLIDIAHPAHVHFFRNFMRGMASRGHEIRITARDKEVTLALLDAYGFSYTNRGSIQKAVWKKAFDLIRIDARLLRIAKEWRPDLLMGVHNPYIAHVGRLTGKPSLIFTDTEGVRIASILTYPFASAICTPSCFREAINPKKHVRFRGYKELAYLHPSYFTPRVEDLEEVGLTRSDRFIILRLISWGAIHDTTLRGIREGSEMEFVRSLEEFGRVLITSERPLRGDLDRYRVRISPEKIHSLLSFAELYIGEGGTMAAEAAVLGTPAIHIEADSSGQATGESIGNFRELRDVYDLLYFFPDQESALRKAMAVLQKGNSKAEWKRKRERLLSEKIDVTAWMVRFVEGFPDSMRAMNREAEP
jgi:predicted glycosyltransferase